MTDTSPTRTSPNAAAPGFPAVPHILLAGIAGEFLFEFLAFAIAPGFLGRPMTPSILVTELARLQLGLEIGSLGGWIGHLLAGAVVFPLGYAVFRSATGLRGWALAGLAWGLILWLFAQAILAPLAGRPFMLGFVPYAWASLIAHGLYGMTVAYVLDRLANRPRPLST